MPSEVLKQIGMVVLAVAIFLGGLWAYIAHLKRVAPAPSDAGPEFQGRTADRKFAKLDVLSTACLLPFVLSIGIPTYFLLRTIEDLRIAMLPSAELTFPASGAALGLIAGFSTTGLALVTLLPIMERAWPDDMRWYTTYLAVRRYGCDYLRLCRGLGAATILTALAMLPFTLNCYVQIRNESFAFHYFMALHEENIPFSDIERIETAPTSVAPNGRVRHEREFVVHFKDGQKWVAGDLPSGSVADRTRVAKLLSVKSGVPITKSPRFSTSDLYD